MIVVIGRAQTDAGKREKLIEIGRALAAASRAEAGCVGYRFFADTENPNEFVFVEEWETIEALRQHFSTPHVAAFMKAAGSAVVSPPDIKIHTVAVTQDPSDIGAG